MSEDMDLLKLSTQCPIYPSCKLSYNHIIGSQFRRESDLYPYILSPYPLVHCFIICLHKSWPSVDDLRFIFACLLKLIGKAVVCYLQLNASPIDVILEDLSKVIHYQ